MCWQVEHRGASVSKAIVVTTTSINSVLEGTV
jgi:hypothetical protein